MIAHPAKDAVSTAKPMQSGLLPDADRHAEATAPNGVENRPGSAAAPEAIRTGARAAMQGTVRSAGKTGWPGLHGGHQRVQVQRGDPELADWTLTLTRAIWLGIALTLVSLPHIERLPRWVPPLFVLLVLYKLWSLRRGRHRPNRLLTLLLGLACVVGVGLSLGTVLGRDAGIALLTLLVALKLLETETARDAYVVIFLGFFLVLTNFLYSQSLLSGSYMLLVVLQLTASMWILENPPLAARSTHALSQAACALLWSAPIALALFVLFPRVPGPIWKLPRDATSGVSGLSEQMSPGDLSQLSQSDALAFRVYFDSTPPPSTSRYWRGPVLSRTDGRTWHSAHAPKRKVGEGIIMDGPTIHYTVELEPHNQRWLFVLDVPVKAPRNALLNHDLELRARRKIRRPRRYEATSATQYRVDVDAGSRLSDALSLPPGRHLQARNLAAQWQRRSSNAEALVHHALEFFRNGGFRYTLTPPLLTGDNVDGFLFGSKVGFCEHYAGAFTVLMRAAGIPARVVTGYQGGEVNPISGHLSIRQRDAHAWSEVWLPAKGWVRVDPTAAVAPERVQIGARATLRVNARDDSLGAFQDAGMVRLWDSVEYAIDYLDSNWNRWVLSYGTRQQQRLLSRIGIDSANLTQIGVVSVAVILMLMLLASMFLVRRPAPTHPMQRAMRRLSRRLAWHDIRTSPHESLSALAERVAHSHPQLAAPLNRATQLFDALKYARPAARTPDSKRALGELRQAIDQIPRRIRGRSHSAAADD